MDIKQAVTELERGHKVFRAFEHALEAARAVENLQQVERETQASINGLKQQEGEMRRNLEAANAAVEEALSAAKGVAADAQVKAQSIIAQANAEVAKMVGEARAECDEWTGKRDAAVAELGTKNSEIAAAKKELAALEEKIAQAKATIEAMLK